jgi:hypothetical protein
MQLRPVPRSARAALAIGVLTILVSTGGATAAQAQGAAPGIAVEAVHALGDGQFHFIVDVAEAASGTTVTATPTSPSGDTGGAVTLPSSGSGVYQGPVPLPEDGTWTVTIASADPAGSIDYGFEVSGDTGTPTATTAPATGPTTAPTATTLAPATQAPTTIAPTLTTAPTEEASASAAQASDSGDDGGFPIVLVVIAAAVVVALAGVPLALRTIRKSPDPAHPTGSGPSGPTGPFISD